MPPTSRQPESPIGHLPKECLDDPAFKEDAVREEIIAPILRALGFGYSGLLRVERSRALVHPFFSIGSKRKKVPIIPDYLLWMGSQTFMALDAKGPGENIRQPDHLAQAYSYAIHREVRSPTYALCNGRSFDIYLVQDMSSTPWFSFSFEEAQSDWEMISTRLNPEELNWLLGPQDYDKDLGLHLRTIGCTDQSTIVFPDISLMGIARIGYEEFSITTTVLVDETRYMGSFDFGRAVLTKLVRILPKQTARQIVAKMVNYPCQIAISYPGQPIGLTVTARIGSRLEENDKEHFQPLEVIDIEAFAYSQEE